MLLDKFITYVPFFKFLLISYFQAVSQFSSALETGMLGPVVSQLAVNSEAVAAASQGNMQEFVKALEKSSADSGDAKKEDKQDKPTDEKDDEKMQLD